MECTVNDVGNSICPGHVSGIPGLLFTSFISSMISSQCLIGDPRIYPEDASDLLKDEYDFIIVGAGSSGSVIAHRLSEITDWNILLLEAGGDPTLTSEVPFMFLQNINTNIDWKYKTEKMENSCKGFKGGVCVIPRGKCLGGTSAMNGMLYVRGNKKDYDGWAKLGNIGWSFEEILKYFKKSENYVDSYPPEDRFDNQYHAKDGLLTVSHSVFQNPISNILIEAAKEQGYPIVDVNGKTQNGFTKIPLTIRNGTRCSSAKAFLVSAKNRKNLHVVKNSYVTKILIDEITNEAYGIEFITKSGQTVNVKASKEVIVSAGAINSPQLLMLSGIGPKDHLKEMGINPIIKDLKVGEHFLDHFWYTGELFSINEPDAMKLTPSLMSDIIYGYLKSQSGPFATIGVTEFTGFVDTINPPKSPDYYPDVQVLAFYFSYKETMIRDRALDSLGFDEEYIRTVQELTNSSGVLMLLPEVTHPKSIGKILLRSSSPSDHPKIFHNYLSDPDDIKTIIRGIKLVRKLGNSDIMKKTFGSKSASIKISECKNFDPNTDDYWECAAKQFVSTSFHQAGTCKMGPINDKSAVVDPTLKVYGVKKLRVADASIMPTIITGNTNAACIMIGEKASDLIKKEWMKL